MAGIQSKPLDQPDETRPVDKGKVEIVELDAGTVMRTIGYIKTARIYGQSANDLIIRSTRYCAGRMIQKAYEYHQSAVELSNIAFYMIQVSLNIMKNVDDAIMHLFGIPLSYSLT